MWFYSSLYECALFSVLVLCRCNFHSNNLWCVQKHNSDAEFCASFISSKRVGSKLLLDKLEEVAAIDPHVALILIRLCGGFCCLNHIARATPPPPPRSPPFLSFKALQLFDTGVSHQLLALMHRMLPGNRPNLA